MSELQGSVDRLVGAMSFTEKVGQLNQRLLGWNAVRRAADGSLAASDLLKREIDRWGGLGVLYGLLRADPWSGRHWGNGIRPEERAEAVAVVQRTVLERGARGIGALLSEEAPHGHQALGGTVLPTNLALGATFDPDAVRMAEAAVAGELAASGIHIALVSGLDIARDPRWGRCEECFGEDPLMASRLCEAVVTGMQGEGRSAIGNGGVAVVLKHLAAQGEAVGGRNGQSAIIGPHDLHAIHLPPVEAGVRSGAIGFMAAYNDIDGVPCCANRWLLDEYLRAELGFDGIVMADGLAVDRLASMTGSVEAAGRAALLAGVDVSLWDRGFATLADQGDDESVVDAVDAAVRRVLTLKAMFGLLPSVDGGPAVIGTPDAAGMFAAMEEGRRHSARLARESLVLLGGAARRRVGAPETAAADDRVGGADRDGAGPAGLRAARRIIADPDAGPVVVAGPLADDFACFLGDYTAPPAPGTRTSVYRELVRRCGGDRVRLAVRPDDLTAAQWAGAALVVFVCGGTSERSYDSEFDDNGAAKAVGEHGATCGEGVDLADVTLPWGQDGQMEAIAALTPAMIVAVAVCGRGHVLTGVADRCDAVLWAGYAGPFGPRAVAEALAGDIAVPGRLPVTLPAFAAAVPVRYNDRQCAASVYRDADEPVLRGFGYGEGALAGARVCALRACAGPDGLDVRVTIEAGDAPACGALTVFASCSGGGRVPRLSMLVASAYLTLDAGERRERRFTVPYAELEGAAIVRLHAEAGRGPAAKAVVRLDPAPQGRSAGPR